MRKFFGEKLRRASMRPSRLRPGPLLVTLSLLCALASCAKPPGDASASNQQLKDGMLALDRGDDATAETKLKASLDLDPNNSKARTALASLYAKRAGVGLRDWLDPLISAGQQIDSKSRTYDQLRGVLDRLVSVDEGGSIRPPGEAAGPGVTPDQIKKRVSEVALHVGRAALGIVITIDLFQSIPFLRPEQVSSLDQAIAVLRQDNPIPERRKEEVRVYLAILSFVRVVHFSREVVGTTDEDLRQLFTARSRLCNLSLPDLKPRALQIRNSLLSLEEGLAVAPGEAPNKYRDARRKIHDVLEKELSGVDWRHLEAYFDEGTAENQGAQRFIQRVCGFAVERATTGNQPPPGFKPGANLFNPDDS